MAHGLTDEQARATPTVSALSIGGLIKHVTGMQRIWMQRVAAAPDKPPTDTRDIEERTREYRDEYVMGPHQTLAGLLDAYAAQNAETLRLAQTADLDAAVPVPRDSPWFPGGRGGVVGALGVPACDQRVGPARRARRHHPRKASTAQPCTN